MTLSLQVLDSRTFTPARSCGGCTLCCKVMDVRSINKPAGSWCTDCTVGQGCNVYQDRPEECRNFVCSWLSGLLPEEDRPDRTGIVLVEAITYLSTGNPVFGFTMHESWTGAARQARNHAVVRGIVKAGVPLTIFHPGGTGRATAVYWDGRDPVLVPIECKDGRVLQAFDPATQVNLLDHLAPEQLQHVANLLEENT